MLICPISGLKMKTARARGVSFWYCSLSRTRAISLGEARKVFGVDSTRELWIRSEIASNPSEWNCPSCTKKMKVVVEPKWMKGGELDVCRSCRLIWLKADSHLEVPHPEDFLISKGDSTVIQDRAEGVMELMLAQQRAEYEKNAWVTSPPPEISKRILGFMGVPVEENSNDSSILETWVTSLILLTCFMLHVFFHFNGSTGAHFQKYGFLPSEPFKNSGLNIFLASFLHGGWFHLIFNLYFFNMFADDVEEYLGKIKFVVLVVVASLSTAFFQIWLGTKPMIPHVGLSGVVMAMMCFYAFAFPKNRIAFLIPGIHIWNHGDGEAWIRTLRWWRLPAWIVFGFYTAKDFLKYFFFEKAGWGDVSHSGHLGGIFAGLVIWFLFSKPKLIQERKEEVNLMLVPPSE